MDSAEEKWREGERYEWIARVFKITQFYFQTIQISHIRMWAMKLANHTRQTTKKKLKSVHMRISMNFVIDRQIILKINQTMIVPYHSEIFRQQFFSFLVFFFGLV